MKLLQSPWILGGFALVVTLAMQFVLMSGKFEEMAKIIEPPKQVVIEPTSVFWTFRTREMDALAQNLRNKNDGLRKREVEVAAISARLDAEKKELELLKKDIEKSREALSQKIIEVDTAEIKNLRTLATTYTSMAPDAVVKVFAHMNDVLVVKITSCMTAEVVGAIFQSMANATAVEGVSAERVARLSELIRLRLDIKK